MKPKLHITIGIPVYNEEANIAALIHAIFLQSHDTYILDRVIVLSDGSTDHTTDIVSNLTRTYKKLRYIHDTKRRGVPYRTQQLFGMLTSDILILLDGDVLPKNTQTISHLAQVFHNPDVLLATASLEPIRATRGFEGYLYAWRTVWKTLTHTWQNGNNIYNFRGVGIAIRKNFASTIRIPKGISGALSHYLYLLAKRRSIQTAFCASSVIAYRLAATHGDYTKQLNRGNNDGKMLKSLFPDQYATAYTIPLSTKFSVLANCIARRPYQTFVGLAFMAVYAVLPKRHVSCDTNGIWETVPSTKSFRLEAMI